MKSGEAEREGEEGTERGGEEEEKKMRPSSFTGDEVCNWAKISLSEKDYFSAIYLFSEAIKLFTDDSKSASCYAGMAKCHLFKRNWIEAQRNGEEPILLSPHNYKAQFYLAIAFAQQTDYAQAIEAYNKALEHGTSKKINSEKLRMIGRHVKQAKFLMWEKERVYAPVEEPPIYFLCPISHDVMTDPVTTSYGINYDKDQMMKHLQFNRIATDPVGQDRLTEKKLIPNQSLKQAVEAYKTGLSVPSYLTCKLTSEILDDPVMGPSGITYERQAITDYLEHRKVDPISAKRLTVEQLVPNLAMRDVLDAYKEANPWVYKKHVRKTEQGTLYIDF